jgi:GNAT superfamily N-acetyltransferase
VQDIPIRIKLNPEQEEVARLGSRLREYNLSRAQEWNYNGLLLSIEDGSGELVGGFYGHTSYSWLMVEALWVAEQMRGCGYGSALLKQAEEHARQNGCHSAWLDTFSFQARGFYEKQGYTLFGELPNYPAGHQRYFLSRKLS